MTDKNKGDPKITPKHTQFHYNTEGLEEPVLFNPIIKYLDFTIDEDMQALPSGSATRTRAIRKAMMDMGATHEQAELLLCYIGEGYGV